MRTKTEIEERIKELGKLGNSSKITAKQQFGCGASSAILEWALEEPTYKRTICDLTNQELFELLNIVYETAYCEYIKLDIRSIEKIYPEPNDDFSNVNFHFYVINTDNDTKHLLEVNIYNNLDITVGEDGLDYSINNIIKYIDTIRNMLSKEKPE